MAQPRRQLVDGRHPLGVGPDRRADLDGRRGHLLEEIVGQLQPLGGDAGEVLDPVDPGGDGVPDPGQRVRVCQHLESGLVGRLDHGPKFVVGEL
ncbi:MAG TPA: hypothetical protein PL137_16460, partial [Nocardioides sp.]|nr:hypothetical protein [Nocardioides sp.]